jgi:hypothetical protein
MWRNGGFLYGGFVTSPDGIDREGLMFKVLSGAGVYSYRSGPTTFTGLHALEAGMAGWRFKRDGFEATLWGGVEYQYHYIVPYDAANRLRGETLAPRIAVDLWWEPTAQTMASASAGYSTLATNYSARGALGWRFFDTLYLGPEIQAQGDDRYRQLRFGVHATALKTWLLEWSAGFGFVQDSDQRAGAYGRFGVLMRQ